MTTVSDRHTMAVALPPGPRVPRAVQGAIAVANRRLALRRMRAWYGPDFTVHLPIFGHTVVISDPDHVRQVFKSPPGTLETIDQNLGRVMGPNSMFALTGDRHRAQRKLLAPPFHGRRLKAYEALMEAETLREMVTWPVGAEFATMPSMMRITLNVILRAVFGAEGQQLERLRVLLPPMVELGSLLTLIPVPQWDWGRFSPWGRLFAYRRTYDSIVDELIAKAQSDSGLGDRDDVLALMLQSRYDDGTQMSRDEIADELITLLSAGHETTATTLAWGVERLRRHPALLERLVAELDAGNEDLLDATILEVQRSRPVIDTALRKVVAPSYQLGPWTLPRGQTILLSIGLMHDDEALFADPGRFDPYRFVGVRPDNNQWVPFGGGARRCIGASFASMELKVVLRTMLREFTLGPTTAPDERWRSRGVALAPAKGGLAVLTSRRHTAGGSSDSADLRHRR